MTFSLANTLKSRRGLIWLAAVLLLGAAVWKVSIPIAVGPAAGVAIEHCDAPPPSLPVDQATGVTIEHASYVELPLRVGTFNIHGCKGPDGRRDVDRVAKCLEGLDFVALQEVHGPRPWENLDQAGELGGRLHMDWLFAPNTRDWRCLDFGNGLLSTTPVESWQRIPLANYGGRGYRNAVLVSLKRRQGDVRVLLTHISRSNDRERTEQLRTVIAMFLALREPAILLGDLNSEATDPQIRALLATPGVTDAVGKILGEKDEPGRIDWIIARGMRATKAGIRDNEASDHPAVWAELEQ